MAVTAYQKLVLNQQESTRHNMENNTGPTAGQASADKPVTPASDRPKRPLPTYLKGHKVKALIKQLGRRSGDEFILLLDKYVEKKIKQACEVHNGGKKTLDATVAGHVGITG